MIDDELFERMIKANKNGTLKIRILDEPERTTDTVGEDADSGHSKQD